MKKKIIMTLSFVTLLTACGEETQTNEVDANDVESLQAELEAAYSRIDELEKELSISNEEETEETEDVSDVENNESNNDLFGLNETMSLTDDSGEELVRLTITQATNNKDVFPSHMVSLDEYDTNRIVAITIDYENVAYEGTYIPSAHHFQAYSKDGEPLERVSQQSGQDAVSQGRKGTTQIYFNYPDGVDELDSFELDLINYEGTIGTFDLPVE